jgi:hypothetical protein
MSFFLSSWFQSVALPSAPRGGSACRAVSPSGSDVEARAGDRGSARPNQAVPPALESGRAVPPVAGVDGW